MLSPQPRLNVLCIDQYANLGGAQKSLLDLVPSFRERSWNIHALLPGRGDFTSALEDLNCPTHFYRTRCYSKVRKPPAELFKYFAEFPGHARLLTKIVRRLQINLLYVNGPRALPATAWVARRCSLPVVFHCHNRLHQSLAIELVGRSLQLARANVLACCRFALEPLLPYIDPHRYQVVYNGVGPAMRMNGRRKSCPIRRIGVVGRIEEEKGQLEFVLAARLLQGQFENLEFFVIGAPLFSTAAYLNRVRAAADDLPIHFTGWKSNIAESFSQLDLLVVPSSPLDATPRVILEAQQMKIPVVAFAVGGIPEIVRDMETGFLVDRRTPEALADKIASVLRLDEGQIEQLTERAWEACTNSYSLASYRQRVGDFLECSGLMA